MEGVANRATRNFDIKSLRQLLNEILTEEELLELVRLAELVPGDMDPAQLSSSNLLQSLANHFFKSENVREQVSKVLQQETTVDSVRVDQFSDEQLESYAEGTDRLAQLLWVLGTHESQERQNLCQDLMRKGALRRLTRKPGSVSGSKAKDDTAEEPDGRRLYQKNQRLQGMISNMQNEIERLKNDKLRGKQESEELRLRNENLKKRLEQTTGIEGLRERLAQVEREKQHVIYELNRKTHELHQVQQKYAIFSHLDTEVLVLRSKLARVLDDALVERRRFAEQLARLTESNRQSLELYQEEKFKNLGAADRDSEEIRVGVFVDVQNMFYAARNRFNGRLDYQALLKVVSQGRKVVKANAYIIQTPDIDQSNFILLLEHCGYSVHSKYLRTRYDGSAKGDWDMEIAIDIISMIGQLDVISLVSGDGDFVALVKMVQRHGLEVEVHSFEHNTAVDLREASDRFYPIQEDLILQ